MNDRTTDLRVMTPREVGNLMRVDPKTVSRWVKDGRLRCVRTPGGALRIPQGDVIDLLDGLPSRVLHLTDDQIGKAIATLALVTDRTFHGPLSEAEAAPLRALLAALAGGNR